MAFLFKRGAARKNTKVFASGEIKSGDSDHRARVFSYTTLPDGKRKVRISREALSRANERVRKFA